MRAGIYSVASEADMIALGQTFITQLHAGDCVMLSGELGAGKTTFVRGCLLGLGWEEPVRSPTYNLIQLFDTNPLVLHADLYRVKSYEGIGIEDYIDDHICFIEWPDRADGLVQPDAAWDVRIAFSPGGRTVEIVAPRV